MSVDYYAAKSRDHELLLSAVGGGDPAGLPALSTPELLGMLLDDVLGLVPFKKDYVRIAEYEGISEEEARARYPWTELNWEDPADRGYVQVAVHERFVTLSTGGGESCIAATQAVIEALLGAGLNVYDPQQDVWW